MTYAQHLATNGGIANCGEHIGVTVTASEDIKYVPAGWIGIPLEEATEKIVQEALDLAHKGRSVWPEKEKIEQLKLSNKNKAKPLLNY